MNTVNLEKWAKVLFVSLGIILTVTIAFSTLGFISNSKVHYANFMLGIMILSSLYGVQDLFKEPGEHGYKRLFLFRCGLLIIGAALAIFGAVFVRVNAIRLDQIHPFFEDFDFYMGLVLLTGVLLLTWFHWGLILTSLITITVIYFFFGQYVTLPILMLPEYDPKFVMNYLGLGLAEGMFWFARVAADNIYFLIIYASLLLGVGMLNLVIEVGKVAKSGAGYMRKSSK